MQAEPGTARAVTGFRKGKGFNSWLTGENSFKPPKANERMDWSVTNSLLTLAAILFVYYMKPILWPKVQNVSGPIPLPMFGSVLSALNKGMGFFDLECIQKYGKVFRYYEGPLETVVVGDVEILKQILVKDFGDFRNRRVFPLRGIFKKGLFDAADQDWTRLRHLLTPSFTSGKLKRMIPVVEKCGERLISNLEEGAKKREAIEAKRIAGAYTMDVIASTAFGLELDSQKDIYNPFLTHALKLFNFRILRSPLIILAFFFPFTIPLLEKMGFVAGERNSFEFFEKFLRRCIKERQSQLKNEPDFLGYMLEAENQELDQEGKEDLAGVDKVSDDDMKKGFSSDEVLAQSLLFFLAAYDTTSTTISFMLYNLSQNQEAQERLYQEIQDTMKDYKSANYEAISKMTYMEQCIQETLRMFPPVNRVDRRSARAVDINGLHMPASTITQVPIYALHHDPEVFPDPDKFDPDRFTAEARQSRSQFYHLPFGLGPRQCIGMRLALMEMKLALVKLLTTYRFTDAGIPLQLETNFLTRSKNGVWIRPEIR